MEGFTIIFPSSNLKDNIFILEEQTIQAILQLPNPNDAARLCGIPRSTFYRLLYKHKIRIKKEQEVPIINIDSTEKITSNPLPIREVAKMFGISKNFVYVLRRTKGLPIYHLGRKPYVKPSDVVALIK